MNLNSTFVSITLRLFIFLILVEAQGIPKEVTGNFTVIAVGNKLIKLIFAHKFEK